MTTRVTGNVHCDSYLFEDSAAHNLSATLGSFA